MGQLKQAIKNFGEYVLSSQKKAITIALIASLIPFCAWLGIIIMVLVTLRKGPKEGFILLLWSSLPSVVVSYIYQPVMMLWINTLGVYCLTWGLAVFLRRTHSWSRLFDGLLWLSIAVVACAHAWFADLPQVWAHLLIESYSRMTVFMQWSMDKKEAAYYANMMAPYFTGIQLATLSVGNLLNIAFARWMQALMFNPGGLRKELYQLRFAWWQVPLVLLLVCLAEMLKWPFALDSLPIIGTLFLLAGLSVVHSIVHRAQLPTVYLGGLYLLLFVLFRYMALLLIVIAMLDSVYNIRLKCSQYIAKKEGDN